MSLTHGQLAVPGSIPRLAITDDARTWARLGGVRPPRLVRRMADQHSVVLRLLGYMPMVPGMSAQPVTGSLRAAGRLAGVGLATVLVFLGVFAVWSSNRSVNAASQLKRSQLVSSAYASARFALDDERLLEHQYMLGHGGNYARPSTPGLQAQFDSLSNEATTALLALERLGDPGDRQLAARLLVTQRAYHAATDRVFAAAMMGNQSMAQVHGSSADRSFNQLSVELAV